MQPPVIFFQRPFPNANMLVLTGKQPILVDTGFGSEIDDTLRLLREAGIAPESLQLIVNSHWHCDHAGGNHVLQQTYNIPIAAHHIEGEIINQRDADHACDAKWLVQPMLPYTVDRLLTAGDVLDTGARQWQVLHTPGHSQGHISLYSDGILIAGDTVHADDVAWLKTAQLGFDTVFTWVFSTLDQLAQLPLTVSYSGHGAATHHPRQRIDEARKRYERWMAHPERVGWHAAKRIVSYYMMLYDDQTSDYVRAYLLRSPWYVDYCRTLFDVEPAELIEPLLTELQRSGAAAPVNGIWKAGAPYHDVPRHWLDSVPDITDW